MKTPEDEAFDELARKQGAWGGGFPAKRKMAADKLQEPSATRPCRSCGGTGERWTGIDEAPTSICKPCDGTGQIALALPAQDVDYWIREATAARQAEMALRRELEAQPVREQWLQSVAKKIEAALLSHRLSLHKDAEDDGVGYPLVDALCCGQKSLEFGKREVEDIVETIYYVLDANTPPTPAAQPAQEPPSEWAGIKAVLDEYGLQAIDFVADFKAALAQPAREPVAWVCEGCASDEKHAIDYWQEDADDIPIGTLLYAASPKREWVGLTDDDKYEFAAAQHSWEDLCLAVEAKLKEKNT
jgi:hypothetical protein